MKRCFTNAFIPKINHNWLSHEVKLMIHRVIKSRKLTNSVKISGQFIAMGLIYLIKVYYLLILWNISLILFKIWLSHAFMSLLLQSTKGAKKYMTSSSFNIYFPLELKLYSCFYHHSIWYSIKIVINYRFLATSVVNHGHNFFRVTPVTLINSLLVHIL